MEAHKIFFEKFSKVIPDSYFNDVYNYVNELINDINIKADVLILAGGDHLYWYNNARYKLKESNLMSGFLGVYNLLKKQKNEFVVITARGGFIKEMKDDAIRLLEENNIKFDKYYWNVENKFEICKKENVDIMIDDDWRIIKKLADEQIKTLYFRDTNLVELEENEYIKEVNNWGDIYRILREGK